MKNIYRKLSQIGKDEREAALCVIVKSSGSTPRKAGAKMIVYDDGTIAGSIGGNSLEKKTIEHALEIIREKKPGLYEYNLVNDLGMCCGGSVMVYIEPLIKTKQLFIFGAGHVGKALAEFAVKTDFDVTLIDDREEMFDKISDEEIKKIKTFSPSVIEKPSTTKNTFIVIVTYNHSLDRQILKICLKKNFGYLGMMGSKRKILMTKRILLGDENIHEEDLSKVDMPVGIDIHAHTPEEIAVSILAKLIQVRNRKYLYPAKTDLRRLEESIKETCLVKS